VPPNFQIPTSYVRYKRPTRAELTETLEYVVDAEDEAWLQQNKKFGANTHKRSSDVGDEIVVPQPPLPNTTTPLSLGMLEIMLDSLEKATAFEAIITLDQAERLILAKIPQLYHMYPTQGRPGVVTIKHVIQDVYNYWVQKRSKLKRPLLRHFWPVTSTDDTNPHLVFRPREKEKYKLRKKRQNDMDAYRKMKQLRNDFDNVRALLELVKRREELNRSLVQLQCELFQQRLFDLIDTSGWPRLTTRIDRDEIDTLLDVPKLFDPQEGGANGKRGKKRRRDGEDSLTGARTAGAGAAGMGSDRDASGRQSSDPGAATAPKAIIAGQNGGEPAPNFMNPLQTRERYVTSWDNAVPAVTSYVDSNPTPTFRFRHRPRIGRGGRVLIDRIPHPAHPNITPITVFTAGNGLPRSIYPKHRLLDLLPRPLDYPSLSRRIEELCVDLLEEDKDATTRGNLGAMSVGDADDKECDAVLVKVSEWLDTDDQLWGEEMFPPIGPL
jgi:enhancer of polycomb-like protein